MTLTHILQETADFGIEYPNGETDAMIMPYETVLERLPFFKSCASRAHWANTRGHVLVLRGRANPNPNEDAITWQRYQGNNGLLHKRKHFRRG